MLGLYPQSSWFLISFKSVVHNYCTKPTWMVTSLWLLISLEFRFPFCVFSLWKMITWATFLSCHYGIGLHSRPKAQVSNIHKSQRESDTDPKIAMCWGVAYSKGSSYDHITRPASRGAPSLLWARIVCLSLVRSPIWRQTHFDSSCVSLNSLPVSCSSYAHISFAHDF